ncbi:ATP-binding protein [Streptomyces sp. NPDC046853]|uniref:ATP-binding protein n=1 Tax=unclassified Streptomyces TaxID=2593676 RepID=UPI0033D92F99
MPNTSAEELVVISRSCEVRMEYDPHCLEQIRRIVGACLRSWGLEALVDDCAFVATELCSNVRHCTRSSFEFAVRRTGAEGVRLEVTDTSTELPVVPTEPPDPFQVSGRGLFLVAALSTDVGVEPTLGGKMVWAELKVPGFG